jgi:uncharacterized protein YrrD
MPVFPDALHAGADVYSSDGHKLGTLYRVVVRRSDLSVSHVVVDIGFLRSGHRLWEGGFGLDYDRVVPIETVSSAGEDRVDLAMSASEFKDAPEYTDEAFEPPQDLTPDEFDIPDVANRLQHLSAMISNTSNTWVFERLNKPVDAVDIKSDTDVWRREPHQKLGDIKRLIMDGSTGRVRAFVISRGFIFKHEVILPVRYVAEIEDDIVRVDIPDEDLVQLREYSDPEEAS